jgi:hypothetical protein
MSLRFTDKVLVRVQNFVKFCVGWKDDEEMLSFKFSGDVNEFKERLSVSDVTMAKNNEYCL